MPRNGPLALEQEGWAALSSDGQTARKSSSAFSIAAWCSSGAPEGRGAAARHARDLHLRPPLSRHDGSDGHLRVLPPPASPVIERYAGAPWPAGTWAAR